MREKQEEQDDVHHHHHHAPTQKSSSKKLKLSNQSKSLVSFHHIYTLAAMIILSATAMVRLEDFSFLVFSLLYMLFLSKFAFPSLSPSPPPPVFTEDNKILPLYVLFAAIVGLFLPSAYMIGGIFMADEEGVRAAAPHLFLLSSQVVMEGLAFRGGFSIPVRAFVPIFYNSRRIFTLVDWLRSEFHGVGSGYRLCVGRGLAMVNMALWCFNLFGFWLPVYLPGLSRCTSRS